MQTRQVGYICVRDFAGIKNGRASSRFERFGDANRHAMQRAVELDREVRIFNLAGEHIVTYVRGPSGRALVKAVGDEVMS